MLVLENTRFAAILATSHGRLPLPWGRPGKTPCVLLGHLPADAWSLRPPPLGGNPSSCPFPRNLKDSVKGRQGVPLARDKSQAAPRRPRRTRTRCILALKDTREEDDPPEVDVLRKHGKEARRSTAPTGQRWPGRHVARNHGRPQARSHYGRDSPANHTLQSHGCSRAGIVNPVEASNSSISAERGNFRPAAAVAAFRARSQAWSIRPTCR